MSPAAGNHRQPGPLAQLLQTGTPAELRRERLRWQLALPRARRRLRQAEQNHTADLAPLFAALPAGNPDAGEQLLARDNPAETPHDFLHLHDLAAQASPEARQYARASVQHWIQNTPRSAAHAPWLPEVAARRILSWCLAWPFFGASGNLNFRRATLAALKTQGDWLAEIAPAGLRGQPALAQHIAALLARLMEQNPEHAQDPVFDARLAALTDSLAAELGDDGSIPERQPSALLDLWSDLTHLRLALRRCARTREAELLEPRIAAVADALAALSHGAAGLALFHGARAERRRLASLRGRLPQRPPSRSVMGFERLQAGGVRVIADCAAAAPPAVASGRYHLAPAALEVSVDGERLVTGCGTVDTAPWTQALRQTAAHSCLGFSAGERELAPGEFAGRRLWYGVAAETEYGNVRLERREHEHAVELVYGHRAWRRHGQTYSERSLRLHDDGARLFGRERLHAERPCSFALRFHLAPEIDSHPARDRRSALLRTRGGDLWRLRIDSEHGGNSDGDSDNDGGGDGNDSDVIFQREESVVSLEGTPERSTQWVARGTTSTRREAALLWSLTREKNA
ncbi:MAG: heparinase II/III family protein [Alphaproteobacteria bacterium]|nr:heparinase II/III family protein [Alphaproteobacteria bacterium]MDA7988831.1 heparinase II/III family protein [Alphaproteobacteria bacterium]MDA8009375.1 heparinase II/III family protein [Alphaproteobacteria bacterium]